MNNEMNQYLPIFIEESKDNLQRLNESLLELEKNPEDKGMIDEIFRVAHTLKGMSGTMGFMNMQKLTHAAENVLDAIRNHKVIVNANLIDVLFSSLDALEKYVGEIINTGTEGKEEYADLLALLENMVNQTSVSETKVETVDEVKVADKLFTLTPVLMNKITQAIQNGYHVFEMKVMLKESCILKGARGFLIFKAIGEFCEILDSNPKAKDIEEENFDLELQFLCLSKHPLENISISVSSVSEVEEVILYSLDKEQFMNKNQQAVVTPTHPTEQKQEQNKPQVANKTVRVNIDRLDTLMNLVSELIIIKTQLEGVDKSGEQSNYHESIEYLERITTNLHDAVMKVRMVPIETVFNRFPRMIRDVSRKLDKNIEFHISGEDTELDRTVIDEIGDPLIHLLRNAADHGLETREERKLANKEDLSHIYLRAYQDGNNVVIEVEDDGRGINVEKVKAKAIEKGAVSAEVAETLTEQEIIELLFSPSFSTSDTVTDLSGRGVGLDVVKSKIATLGGNVTVQTKLGEGSKFIIRLPLTLAIIQALMVQISNEKYAIPLNNIQNIEAVHKDSIKKVQNQEIIILRDQVIPIIRLDNMLDIAKHEDSEELIVVIVKKNEKYTGFIVDSLIGQQEIVIKSLGRYLGSVEMIAGATILGNGEVALILDVNSIA